MVNARGGGVNTSGVRGCQSKVHTNKVPARPGGTNWQVGDEEQLVGAACNGGGESGRAGRRLGERSGWVGRRRECIHGSE
jgi:hypothetical protein